MDRPALSVNALELWCLVRLLSVWKWPPVALPGDRELSTDAVAFARGQPTGRRCNRSAQLKGLVLHILFDLGVLDLAASCVVSLIKSASLSSRLHAGQATRQQPTNLRQQKIWRRIV